MGEGFNKVTIAAGMLVFASFAVPAWIAEGQTSTKADGRQLADRLCAGCHAVGADEAASPHAMAPRFAEVARRYPPEMLAESLAEGIAVGHQEGVKMPEFTLDTDDIEALIAYLESLASTAP